jgi:hypothetical protein
MAHDATFVAGILPAAMDWSLTCGRTEIKLISVVVSGKRHEPRVPSPLP